MNWESGLGRAQSGAQLCAVHRRHHAGILSAVAAGECFGILRQKCHADVEIMVMMIRGDVARCFTRCWRIAQLQIVVVTIAAIMTGFMIQMHQSGIVPMLRQNRMQSSVLQIF